MSMKSTNNDAIRVISVKGQRKIEELWLRKFHDGSKEEREQSNAIRWFNVVLDFLSARGDEIFPGVLRDQEHKVIEQGLSQEYMATLAEVVDCTGCRTEYDKAVLILTATPEERAQALQKVLGT